MNKTELVAAMAEQTQLSKKDAESALKAFIDVVYEKRRKSTAGRFRYLRSIRKSSKRRKKPGYRRIHGNQSFQSSKIQSWKSSERSGKRIIHI